MHGPTPADANPDMTVCDREPIHLSGAIQPHGLLFALTGPDLTISAVSVNVANHLGRDAADLMGRSVAELMDAESFSAVLPKAAAEAANREDALTMRYIDLRLHGTSGSPWRALVHAMPNGLLLEAEQPRQQVELTATELFDRYERVTRRLRDAADTVTVCQYLAEEVRRLTGYDRVKIYRFALDNSGEVLAEASNGILPSYLGLHFPASDIPAQARELYRHNPERQIPDIAYEPVPLLQADPTPIDLSLVTLRNVSPIHRDYLRNMAVGASMSLSILRHGQLWGMINCHHHTTHYVTPVLRQTSLLVAQLAAWQLTLVEAAETMRLDASVRAIETILLQETAVGQDYRAALLRNSDRLLDLLRASGLAVWTGSVMTTFGKVPADTVLSGLHAWLSQRASTVFETSNLAAHYPDAAGLTEAAGILAVPLGGMSDNLMVWFRPEVTRTVDWAGDPTKPVASVAGQDRLHPRRSFAPWTQRVLGCSRTWQRHEVGAAQSLRDMLADIILRRSLEMELMNEQLMRSNKELEAFAYVAAHDLKEPLHQIEAFSLLLKRVFEGDAPLPADPKVWLNGIQTSTRRLRELIDDVAEYSRLGRHSNPMAAADLDAIVTAVKADLSAVIEATGATIVASPLPTLICDHSQIRQVFQNIISNALKYRHPDRPPLIRIDASVATEEADTGPRHLPVLTLTITDNGIGFDEQHRERIFEPFHRLHSSDDYEGSGIGLAICQKVIDRHHGSLTASSRPGEGSVFTINLPVRPAQADG